MGENGRKWETSAAGLGPRGKRLGNQTPVIWVLNKSRAQGGVKGKPFPCLSSPGIPPQHQGRNKINPSTSPHLQLGAF